MDDNVLYLMIAGSRGFSDYKLLSRVCDNIRKKYPDIIIVSGGARGADTLAEKYAKEKGIETKIFKAQWNLYGKAAGYRRNAEMQKFIQQHPNRLVVCFWDGSSPGTQHNFGLAKTLGNPIRVYDYLAKKEIKF